MSRYFALIVLLVLILTACGLPSNAGSIASGAQGSSLGSSSKLRLATTTSTADSGLLDAILPDFEQQYNIDVEVVAVGTGQALKLGENGDADVVLVHARQREEEFIANGFGSERRDVMYNDFVVVGPPGDPADVASADNAVTAFRRIAASESLFASRGDESGTHLKEETLWSEAQIEPSMPWYRSLGQGMGETLIAAEELGAYALTDRATFLSMRDRLPDLRLVWGGATIEENSDPLLRNPYGVIVVNMARHGGTVNEHAIHFADWITSAPVQDQIGSFGVERFEQPLFYPLAN
jgi:tungstate transport system substrate-binding protein